MVTQTSQTHKMRLSIDMTRTTKVFVWRADLTTFDVDAVVSVANVELQHSGGLALALSKTAGAEN